MAARVPQALVFDIGRVIVRVNVPRAMETLGSSVGMTSEQVWSAIGTDPRFRDFQEGRLSPQHWHAHLVRRLGLALTFEQFCAAWNSALDPAPILSEELFAQLAAQHRLVLLSNTDPIHVAHIETHFRFPRHFPARVYSCAAGISKPDPAIYRQAIRHAGVPAEQTLYIDDVAEYVEAGRRAGMQGLLFQSAEQLLGEFRKCGILRE